MALTQALTELVDTIGLPATVELVRTYAGRALYVPQEPDDRHPITLRIGLIAARSLSTAYGGTYLHVPPERNLLVELRNAEIVRRIVEDHESICSTAYAFGVSRRWVHRVLERAGHERAAANTNQKPGHDSRQLSMWNETRAK